MEWVLDVQGNIFVLISTGFRAVPSEDSVSWISGTRVAEGQPRCDTNHRDPTKKARLTPRLIFDSLHETPPPLQPPVWRSELGQNVHHLEMWQRWNTQCQIKHIIVRNWNGVAQIPSPASSCLHMNMPSWKVLGGWKHPAGRGMFGTRIGGARCAVSVSPSAPPRSPALLRNPMPAILHWCCVNVLSCQNSAWLAPGSCNRCSPTSSLLLN